MKQLKKEGGVGFLLLICPLLLQAGHINLHKTKSAAVKSSHYFYFTGMAGVSNVRTSTHLAVNVDEQDFIYNSQNKNNVSGLVGGQMGLEIPLSNYFLQAGVQFTYSDNTLHGNHLVGMEPQTYTNYAYTYELSSQQLMAVAKLLSNHSPVYHPYLFAGIGESINKTSSFKAMASDTGTANVTPDFQDELRSSFSYSLGLGVEKTINDHLRFGIGYAFSDLGKSGLGQGNLMINSATLPVPFTLSQKHNYLNQMTAQFTYTA